jgi:hypothetical protein
MHSLDRVVGTRPLSQHMRMLKRAEKLGNRRDMERAKRRRYDDRVKRGARIAPVEYNACTLNFLIKLAWLQEKDACNSNSVGRAIEALLKASADT